MRSDGRRLVSLLEQEKATSVGRAIVVQEGRSRKAWLTAVDGRAAVEWRNRADTGSSPQTRRLQNDGRRAVVRGMDG